MPIVDMPLEKLKTYHGINPRPDDFDEFWDRSLAEMRAIDPKPEFKPYPFPSKVGDCYELHLRLPKAQKYTQSLSSLKILPIKFPRS